MSSKKGQHPVDRGWAWVVLLASLGSSFLSGALVYSVGVLHAGLLRTFRSDSVTMVAMAGAVNSALMCLGAPVASYIINRFGCRTCCVLGGLLCFTGYASSSFVTSVILLFFTFGLTAGLGTGLTYSATNVTVGFYFERHRGLACGISNSLTAVGILCGPVILQALLEEYGISGTFLLVGGVCLHYCFFGMFFRPTIFEGEAVDVDVEEHEYEPIEIQTGRDHRTTDPKPQTLLHASPSREKVSIHRDAEEKKCEYLSETDGKCRAECCEDVISGPFDITSTSEDVKVGVETATSTNDVNCKKTVSTSEIPPTNHHHPNHHLTTESTLDTCEAGNAREDSPPMLPTDDERREKEKSRKRDSERLCDLGTDPVFHKVPTPNNMVETDKAVSDTTPPLPSSKHSSEPDSSHEQRTDQEIPYGPGDTDKEHVHEHLHIQDIVPSQETQPDRPREKDLPDTGKAAEREQCEPLIVPNVASSACQKNELGRSRNVERGQRRKRNRGCGAYRELLSDTPFMLHCASLFVSSVHVSGVFLHLPEYVRHHGTSPAKAAELFITVGLASLVSKLSCGFALSDPNIDPLMLSLGMMGLNGIFTCLFPLYADTYGKQVMFSALFGLYFGGLYAIVSPILVRFAGVSRLADAYGISMTFLGAGYLLGPMFAAMIVDGGGTYSHSFVFLGIMMLSGAILDMTAACFLQSRDKMEEELKENADWSIEGGKKLTPELSETVRGKSTGFSAER